MIEIGIVATIVLILFTKEVFKKPLPLPPPPSKEESLVSALRNFIKEKND